MALGFGSQGQTDFYNTDSIQEIRIVFQQSNWRYLLDSLFENFGEEARMDATVYINGIQYKHAGVRYKGFSSYDVDQAKNPFNIDLNYGYSWQNHQGFVKLKLSNVIHDPSFVREVLAYEIARNYLPASQANFANVYVNDTLMGLYTNVEAVDKNFISNHFPSDESTFFKGSPETLSYPFGQNSNLAYTHGSVASGYIPYYKLESTEGWDDIFHLIDVLNNDTANLSEVLNVDRTLWMHAFNYSMINLDSYIGYSQNYYMYEDDNGCFNPIPWDLNMSFGSFRQSDGTMINLSIDKIKEIDPLQHLYNLSYSPRPLMKNLFANSTYRRMYMAHLRTIIDEQFRSGLYLSRALQLQSIIDAAVQADSNKFCTYSDFIANVDSTTGPSSDLVPGLRDLMESRMAYLDTYTGFSGAPTLALPALQPSRPTLGANCRVMCQVCDASEVFVFYRFGSNDLFQVDTLFDDGIHGDSLAGDGFYGNNIISSGDILQYYFYAQNDSAGRFLPERAQYEFFTAWPAVQKGSLVINEVKVLNNGTAVDQNAESDAWIEFYNKSAESLQLEGLTLFTATSDTLFVFPDTLMATGSYIILWADGDSSQQGLHSFSTISDTGSLILKYGNDEAIDSLSYGLQIETLSYGSYPNGSTQRCFLSPTYAFKNNLTISESGIFKVFPNPASDKVYIETTPSDGTETIEVFNSSMQRLVWLSHAFGDTPLSSAVAEIDVSGWNPGAYYVRVTVDTTATSLKFMIVR